MARSLFVRQAVTICVISAVLSAVARADWPTWQHDIRRSGFDESISVDVVSPKESWVWQSAFPPAPAWHGPAKWDAYAHIRGLPSMRSYDLAFGVISVGGAVYISSSADDSVRCLDSKTGKIRWVFTTNGPVRIAPMFFEGQIYFGSDDGFAYCVNAQTGKLTWKFSPNPKQLQVINNGRFISPSPCRTGITVQSGRAWFGCGMLPWEPSYLCCVDALTGKTSGKSSSRSAEQFFVRKVSNRTLEGSPAASSELILFPQGRVAPQAFRRIDGADLGSIKKSGGGSLVVVSLDSRILHGPATDSRKGGIAQTNPKTMEMVANYGRGNALVVQGRTSYMVTDDEIVASDLVTQNVIYQKPSEFPFSLIGVGKTLFAGGDQQVAAFEAKTGALLWQASVNGRAYCLAFADNRLLVSTDRGAVHAFEFSKGQGAASLDTASTKSPTAPSRPVGKSNQPVPEWAKDKSLLGAWLFDDTHRTGRAFMNLAGGREATASNAPRMVIDGDTQFLAFDGQQQSLEIASSHRQARMPTRAFTAEAWVRVDSPKEWGGIVGAIQDNGDFERGWLLGFRKQRFSFAVVGSEKEKLTYLTGESDFKRQHWHHVVGTYDGVTMKLYVNGHLEAESKSQTGAIRYPPQAFYVLGAYRDKDEFHHLHGALSEVRIYDRVATAAEIVNRYEAKAGRFPRPIPTHDVAVGPWLQFVRPSQAIVRWETAENNPSVLTVTRTKNGKKQQFGSGEQGKLHAVLVEGLQPNELYTYAVEYQKNGKTLRTREFECDTFFNYSVPYRPLTGEPDVANSVLAGLITHPFRSRREQRSIRQGIGVVIGIEDGGLIEALARRSQLRLVCVDDDLSRVEALRTRILKANLLGGRVSAHHFGNLDEIPFVAHCANLMTTERDFDSTKPFLKWRTISRLLQPGGCWVSLNKGTKELGRQPRQSEAVRHVLPTDGSFPVNLKKPNVTDPAKSNLLILQKKRFEDSGDWKHLYGSPNNSGFSGESLAGAKSKEDLQIQWVGRPGPRYQADRSGRKPSPIAANGRLFLQGLERIIALDQYNGTILWSLEIPGFLRFNVPRDCSNWCADNEYVYAVARNRVWKIAATSGEVVRQYLLPEGDEQKDGPIASADSDWGFIAALGDIVVGSKLPAGSAWTNYWGKEGWYDQRSGPDTFKICSNSLFARNKDDGTLIWNRQRGVVINSTITIEENTIYFVESRNAKVLASKSRRVGMPELWKNQFLVAIDTRTGSTKWEKQIDTEDGTVTFYLAASQGQLVLVSSTDKKYFVNTFDAVNGTAGWNQSFGWIEGKGDHGKAMSRPSIVGNKIFVRPKVLSLKDGTILPMSMPGGGCGTYACTTDALFFRSSQVTMWNHTTGAASKWTRLRPDCWLSTIPAGGMLLSPEGGGGCSCGSWMETSIGFMPVARSMH